MNSLIYSFIYFTDIAHFVHGGSAWSAIEGPFSSDVSKVVLVDLTDKRTRPTDCHSVLFCCLQVKMAAMRSGKLIRAPPHPWETPSGLHERLCQCWFDWCDLYRPLVVDSVPAPNRRPLLDSLSVYSCVFLCAGVLHLCGWVLQLHSWVLHSRSQTWVDDTPSALWWSFWQGER